MGIKSILILGKKGLTQVNKTYVKALNEVRSIGSLGLKMKPLTRTNFEINPVQKIKSLQKRLENVLLSEHCKMPDYMSYIPKNSTKEETTQLLIQMFEDSKFFSRVSTCELQYGKNFAFAKMMSKLSKESVKSISNQKSFKEVLKQIARGYSKETSINPNFINRIGKSGIYRGNATKPPKIIDGYGRSDSYVTGYGDMGIKDGYKDYVERLTSNLNNRVSPYKNFTLTKRVEETMLHPYHEEVSKNMDIIADRYKTYQKLVADYKKTGKLSLEQRKQADNIISEIYYLMANTCPFRRGSNGISDILMRSQYSALGINMPHIKKGVGLDLEAFCFELKDYQKNWKSFFEGGGPIHQVTYKPSLNLIKLDNSTITRAQELVDKGLMRKEFMDNVTNVTSIEECNKLIESATTDWERLYASIRIPSK